MAKNVRISPRKLRLIADFVRGLPVATALTKLQFLTKAGAKPVLKVINAARANTKVKDLIIKNVLIDEGSKMKRQDKSHGARFGRGVIQKRMSHIKVILDGQ